MPFIQASTPREEHLPATVAQSLRAFPQYGIINNRLESQGQSFYNAGKVDLTRRFSNGIQGGLSYTFAKLITDAGEDIFGDSPLNGVIQNPFDRRPLRTISPSIPPHSLVFNYIIELPFGKGRRFLNQGGLVDRAGRRLPGNRHSPLSKWPGPDAVCRRRTAGLPPARRLSRQLASQRHGTAVLYRQPVLAV